MDSEEAENLKSDFLLAVGSRGGVVGHLLKRLVRERSSYITTLAAYY